MKPQNLKPTEDNEQIVLNTKVPKDVYCTLATFAEERKMSVYELLQYILVALAEYAGYKRGIRTDDMEGIEDIVSMFQLDRPDMYERLVAFRNLLGFRKSKREHSDIRQVIVVRDGNVVEVLDPTDDQAGMMGGTMSLSKDKALKVILAQKDGQLHEMFTNVMKDRGTESLYRAIMQLFLEENKYMQRMDDDMMGYAQNEYGTVPIEHRNKPMQ